MTDTNIIHLNRREGMDWIDYMIDTYHVKVALTNNPWESKGEGWECHFDCSHAFAHERNEAISKAVLAYIASLKLDTP